MRRPSGSPTASPELDAPAPSGTSAARRVLAVLVPCLLALVAAGAWVWARHARLAAVATAGTLVESRVLPSIARWSTRPRPAGTVGAVLFGDSLVGIEPASTALGRGLRAELAARGTPVDLLEVTNHSFHAIEFYYLLDEVLAGRPRVAVIEVNLVSFAPDWNSRRGRGFPELSRYLTFARAHAVRDALAEERVGILDPWIYRLRAATHTLHLIEGVRIQGQDVLAAWGDRVNRTLGLDALTLDERRRQDALALLHLGPDLARTWFGGDPTTTPTAHVLRVLVQALRDAGVDVVLYVSPMNVERLAALGLTDELRLDDEVEAVRRAVGARPEEWVDLHAAARGSDFLDGAGHLRPPAIEALTPPIAAAVAARLHGG
jgi:hypothetical protein